MAGPRPPTGPGPGRFASSVGMANAAMKGEESWEFLTACAMGNIAKIEKKLFSHGSSAEGDGSAPCGILAQLQALPAADGRPDPLPARLQLWKQAADDPALRDHVREKVSVNDHNGFTGLALAAEKGHVPACRLLLQARAEVNTTTETGNTPLMWAAGRGHIEVVSLLLKSGANACSANTPQGDTALMWASAQGRTSVARTIMHHCDEMERSGPLPAGIATARMPKGSSPWDARPCKPQMQCNLTRMNAVMFAAATGHHKTLQMLLEQRPAAASELLAMGDRGGNTALHHAAQHGHVDSVRTLLSMRADITLRNSHAAGRLTDGSSRKNKHAIPAAARGVASADAWQSVAEGKDPAAAGATASRAAAAGVAGAGQGDNALEIARREGRHCSVALLEQAWARMVAEREALAEELMLEESEADVDKKKKKKKKKSKKKQNKQSQSEEAAANENGNNEELGTETPANSSVTSSTRSVASLAVSRARAAASGTIAAEAKNATHGTLQPLQQPLQQQQQQQQQQTVEDRDDDVLSCMAEAQLQALEASALATVAKQQQQQQQQQEEREEQEDHEAQQRRQAAEAAHAMEALAGLGGDEFEDGSEATGDLSAHHTCHPLRPYPAGVTYVSNARRTGGRRRYPTRHG